jgi:hypothetical protein
MMPLDEKLLGFSNRWYEGALKESPSVALPSGVTVRAITSLYFLGTNIEAFLGRGDSGLLDYFGYQPKQLAGDKTYPKIASGLNWLGENLGKAR